MNSGVLLCQWGIRDGSKTKWLLHSMYYALLIYFYAKSIYFRFYKNFPVILTLTGVARPFTCTRGIAKVHVHVQNQQVTKLGFVLLILVKKFVP